MPTPDTVTSRRPRAVTVAMVGGWAFFLLAAGFVAFALHAVEASNRRLTQGQQAQATVISQLSTSLDTTRHQLQQHHVTPSAPPAKAIVQQVPGIPTPVPGPAGAPGAPGKDAPTITPSPGQRGPAGSPGPASTIPGPAGAPGSPGPASTVAGPAGPPGKDGKDGKDGSDGKDGASGEPPAGWTYTDPSGVHYTCSRDSNFDPNNPQYHCTADSSPSPSPSSPLLGSLSLGVIATTAAYRRIR